MEIVRSAPVNDSTLVSSSIGDNDDYANYNAGTTYGLGDVVIGPDHHEYESQSAGNTGNALSAGAWWLDRGMNRRWRMFDLSNSSQSSDADVIDVSIAVSGRANAVSLLNIAADTVQIIANTVADGEIYNRTFNLTSDSGINNWYDYFFEPVIRQGDLVVTDLPVFGNPTIQVIATASGSTVRIGTLIVGQLMYIGMNIGPGTRLGIQDFSRVVADDFGNWTLVVRPFSKKAEFKAWIDNSRIDAIAAFLATIRATPCVFNSDGGYAALSIFGFYDDWSIEIPGETESYCSLSVKGLT